jgi:HD-GYP domain-containing protein (c-di-GMP phosphodiesterase class II)
MQRVYKPALPSDKAIELMSRNAANDFDLDIFVPFVQGMQKSHQQLGKMAQKGEIYDCESKETVAQQILRKKGRDKLIA